LLVAARIALYVPSAVDLTRGGFFYQRPEDGSFDTIISAQQILKSMADSHGQQLAALRLQLPASTALLQLPAAADALALSTGGADGSTSAAGGGAGKGGKAKKGGQKDGAGAAAAAAVEGSLMQLVAAGLSTDDDVCVCVWWGGQWRLAALQLPTQRRRPLTHPPYSATHARTPTRPSWRSSAC
jgi:hypothetical protein